MNLMPPNLILGSADSTAERFRSAVEQAILPFWIADTEQRFTAVNDALCQMLGRSRAELLGRSLSDFLHADERERAARDSLLLLSGERDGLAGEKRLLRPGGEIIWALVALRLVRDGGGAGDYVVGQASDVTEHHLRERRLRHLADHDLLTGLVNRRGFGRELRRHLSRITRYGTKGALLMIDIDNFKRYNDTNGHAGGDELLRAVANSLNSRLRAGDVVGRIGGDEFAVLLPEATPEQADVVAAALVQAVRETGADREPRVTASVGIFSFDEAQRVSEDGAMVGADMAMYAAKHAGRNRHAPLQLWTSAPAPGAMSGSD